MNASHSAALPIFHQHEWERVHLQRRVLFRWREQYSTPRTIDANEVDAVFQDLHSLFRVLENPDKP